MTRGPISNNVILKQNLTLVCLQNLAILLSIHTIFTLKNCRYMKFETINVLIVTEKIKHFIVYKWKITRVFRISSFTQ